MDPLMFYNRNINYIIIRIYKRRKRESSIKGQINRIYLKS